MNFPRQRLFTLEVSAPGLKIFNNLAHVLGRGMKTLYESRPCYSAGLDAIQGITYL